MSRSIKAIFSVISVTLCILIALTYPTQVFAQNLPKSEDELTVKNPQEAESYTVGNIISELTDERDEYSKRFRLDDGSYIVASYQQPVHFQDEEGNWIEYNNSLIDETSSSSTNDEATSEEFTNKTSDIKVNYSKKSKENNMIKIKSDNYQVSWGYADTNKVKATIVTNDEELEGNDKYTALKNLTSEVIYENAYDNVDIQYITNTMGVKENIILKNSNTPNEFTIKYKINSLTATAINDKLIELSDKSGEVVYSIEAPYMIDSKGKTSTQLTLSITEQKNSKLTLKLSADKEFLSDCAYPVTIDPAIMTNQEFSDGDCTYANSIESDIVHGITSEGWVYSGTVYVGKYNGYNRTFIKKNTLPTLNKGDMIVAAYLKFHLLNYDFYDTMRIGAYRIKENWNHNKLTWNTQPKFDSVMIDYEDLVANESDSWHDWDVTKCVKGWYNGDANHGVMLMSTDESNEMQCAGFYSTNYPEISTPRPVFEIVYRNNKGLEDQWTYSSFSVGTAGTAYVNDYSGNLVFITSDASTASGYAPASINHIYNGYMAGVKYNRTTPYVGHGWRLNIQQTLLYSSHFNLDEEAQEIYPYVYTDDDGTDHYFMKKTENGTTKYIDEDGSGLELTIDGTDGQVGTEYVITDEKDNKLYFNYRGRFTKTVDSNENTVTVNFSEGSYTNIESVTDASNNAITLTKNADNYLTSVKDPSERITTYEYDENNRLTKITRPNGKFISFEYDPITDALTSVIDVDGYKATFSYTSASSGNKVSAIQEYGKNGTAGQKITFDRTKYNTTIIKTYGADGVANTSDDLTSTYQFDNFGRTIAVRSRTTNRDLGATLYKYTDGKPNFSASNIKQLNRVTTGYSTGSNPTNLLKNSNMESSGVWIEKKWGDRNDFTSETVTTEKYFGKKSMKINVTYHENLSKGRVYQDLDSTVLIPGNVYTLSGYIKTTGVTNSTDNSGALICAESFNTDGTSNPYYSDIVTGNTSTLVDNGWQRVSVTFTVPENSDFTRINLALCGSTGTAYFDGIQLEKYNVANDYNMLENAGLEEYSSNGLPTGWNDAFTSLNTSTDKVSEGHQQGSYSFRIKGEPDKAKGLYQQVPVSGTENDTYIVSGWVKANAVPKPENDNRKFKISIMVRYTDGTYVYKPAAEFNYTISDWQYTSTAFTLSDGDDDTAKTPTAVRIYLSYQYQANYAYFDNICLEKDNAQSYNYDEDGNLISVVDQSEEKSTMEYTNSDLTKNIDAKGYNYTYDYDTKHNMTKATSSTGMNYNYSYTKGLATSLEVKGNNVKSLKSEVTYDSNGMLLTSKDQDENESDYTYHSETGVLQSYEDDSGITNYTYNEKTDQLTSVSKTDDFEELTYSVNYNYSDDNKYLEKISHGNTEYNLEYDEFGNKTDSKVGTQSLASYNYNANNGSMTSSTYGTGQTVSYVYDEYGNTETVNYNGTRAFSWYADRGGNVIKERDFLHNLVYDYTYDSTGRLVRQTAKKTTGAYNANKSWYTLEYSYDLNNNITRLATNTPFASYAANYTYGNDNLLTKYNISTDKYVDYQYDGLNRLTDTSLVTKSPTDTSPTKISIDTSYTYHESQRGNAYTTTKLETETIDGVTYKYEYDTLGNITEIYKNNTLVNYYEYDAMNQLVYERDYSKSTASQYEYDNAGNIQAEYKYTFGTSSVPTSIDNIIYSYDDTNWGDKLTSYDGQTITYDAIGNPLTYRDGITMTWKNGRQLATLQDSDDTISYEYDSNSVRLKKIVDGVEHTYAYLNGLLMYETRGEAKFYYSYDANGILYNVKYTLQDTDETSSYFFTHNSRGDIIGIYNGSGELEAKYEYDSWGKVLSVTDASGNAITSATHIGNLNPFRYRGYYYDSETGLYYLMSRYYDPVTHRFINADDSNVLEVSTDLFNKNLFAYTDNNPVSRVDDEGEFWNIVIGATVGGLLSGGIEVVSQIMSGKSISELDWVSIGIETATGAATGALSACGVPPITYCSISGAIGAASSGLHSWHNGDDGFTIAKKSLSGGLTSIASASAGESLKAIGRKATSAKHMEWGKIGSSIKKQSNTKTHKPNIVLTATKMVKSSFQTVDAPTKSSQKYCRGCCRPIGNQYSWQCSNPWSL